MGIGIAIAFAVRLLLVMLFLPFSALDKILDFSGAVAQAREAVSPQGAASLLIVAGLCVEIGMSAAVLTGIGDRPAAFILAGYCSVTALLWKQFWRPGDFWADHKGHARGLFWDFWKNLSVAGGFLLITFGPTAQTAGDALHHPFVSTHPYRLVNLP